MVHHSQLEVIASTSKMAASPTHSALPQPRDRHSLPGSPGRGLVVLRTFPLLGTSRDFRRPPSGRAAAFLKSRTTGFKSQNSPLPGDVKLLVVKSRRVRFFHFSLKPLKIEKIRGERRSHFNCDGVRPVVAVATGHGSALEGQVYCAGLVQRRLRVRRHATCGEYPQCGERQNTPAHAPKAARHQRPAKPRGAQQAYLTMGNHVHLRAKHR